MPFETFFSSRLKVRSQGSNKGQNVADGMSYPKKT